MPTVTRRTVDLSPYPDLVVVYLGMRVNRLTGLKTLLGFGPKIAGSVAAHPDGLLQHENFVFSFFPMHAGMRQYWRDMESLLARVAARAASPVVEEFPQGFRGHRLLARNLSDPGRDGGHLRRCGRASRLHELRASRARPRPDVWRCSSRRENIRRRTRRQRKRVIWPVASLKQEEPHARPLLPCQRLLCEL
jgi:hypothetical protein